MADVEEDRGGKGKERGIGERRAFFSPLPPLTPFSCDSDPGYGIHGWTGKHRRGFKIIPYHVSPQG